jgi:penicillin-binding protein 2
MFSPALQRRTGGRRQSLGLLLVVLVCAGAMLARLVVLQLVQGAHYRELSDENRIRLMARNPIRGRLLDRHGKVLATSRLTYSLYVQPRQVSLKDWPALRDRLAALLAIPAAELDRRRAEGANAEGFRILLASRLKP